MKRIFALLVACALLLCGCSAPYSGYEEAYYGFSDDTVLGKSYEDILAYFGDPTERSIGENEIGFLDADGRIRYDARADHRYRDERSCDTYVYIAFDADQTAIGWEVVNGPSQKNSTGFGLAGYPYDLVWMTGKTAPEIREKYGFFDREQYDDVPMDAPIVNETKSYIIQKGDMEIAKIDEIIFHVYFNDEGVATRFCEQYGYLGG